MTFNETQHPRTPAGSPDGGKFAPKPGGSEADGQVLTEPEPTPQVSDHTLRAVTKYANNHAPEIFDLAQRAEDLDYEIMRQSVHGLARVAKAICPQAEKAHFHRYDGLGADGSQLSFEGISCPHTSHESGLYEESTFLSEHGVPEGSFHQFGEHLNANNEGALGRLGLRRPADGSTMPVYGDNEWELDIQAWIQEHQGQQLPAPRGERQRAEAVRHYDKYAELGMRVAALLESNEDSVSGADFLENVATEIEGVGLRTPGRPELDLDRFRGMADEYGYDHDGNE